MAILKFKTMMKKPIMVKHTSFKHTFSKINSFAYINNIESQKDFHQDNLPFVCLLFYKDNCLNILAGNIYFLVQVKNQQK